MTEKRKIRLDTSNALQYLGKLYRTPADAIKEHVSNAVDEHTKVKNRAKDTGEWVPPCRVTFIMQQDKVVVEYPYGMTKEEFERALDSVCKSAKPGLDVKQIGQLGIGMFSFFQIGKKCVFISKKGKGHEGVKVTLRAGSDDYDIEIPLKREALQDPGIRIEISELTADPTKARGPLCPTVLEKVFAEKFDSFLREGSLEIVIVSKGSVLHVKPQKIELTRVACDYTDWPVAGSRSKRLSMELYFVPSGNGKVCIRHAGVVVVESFGALGAEAYGLEEEVYGNGDLKGFVDADFLTPLPARTGFEQNADWMDFLKELENRLRSIEGEVEALKAEEAQKKLTQAHREAIELAKEILSAEDFKDLELLDGLGRKRPEHPPPPDGFAFMPASITIPPGKTRSLALKALVPGVIPDATWVEFSLTGSCVELVSPQIVQITASEADEAGIVTVRTSLKSVCTSEEPALFVAKAAGRTAQARIWVRLQEPIGPIEPPDGPEKDRKGKGINYNEVPFLEGQARYCRYDSKSRTVEANKLNPDFKREVDKGTEQSIKAYTALMIGKETIAFNDKTDAADDYLEKLLTFHFRLKHALSGRRSSSVKEGRRKQKGSP